MIKVSNDQEIVYQKESPTQKTKAGKNLIDNQILIQREHIVCRGRSYYKRKHGSGNCHSEKESHYKNRFGKSKIDNQVLTQRSLVSTYY